MLDPSGKPFSVPPTVPRIGGSAAAYVPVQAGGDRDLAWALRRRQSAPGLGLAGQASENPWLGLAQALNAYLSGHGGVGAGTMFGAGFGHGPTAGGLPSRRTIYGPGARAF